MIVQGTSNKVQGTSNKVQGSSQKLQDSSYMLQAKKARFTHKIQVTRFKGQVVNREFGLHYLIRFCRTVQLKL
jgi:hypothetical protein